MAALEVVRLIEFYEARLGFQRSWCDKGYRIVKRDDITIHFWNCNNKIFPENTRCYIFVKGLDQLDEEYTAIAVIHPNALLEDKPWGLREFSISDLNRNLIRFGEPLPQSAN